MVDPVRQKSFYFDELRANNRRSRRQILLSVSSSNNNIKQPSNDKSKHTSSHLATAASHPDGVTSPLASSHPDSVHARADNVLVNVCYKMLSTKLVKQQNPLHEYCSAIRKILVNLFHISSPSFSL